MKKAILATKIGMTQIFNEDGVLVPVTVLQAGPCVVTQVKTVENDGYAAVQVGFVDKKEKIKVHQITIDGNEQLSDRKIKGGLFSKGAFAKTHELVSSPLSSSRRSLPLRDGRKISRNSSTNIMSMVSVMLRFWKIA